MLWCALHRLKAEIDQLTESDSIRQQQIEGLQYEHAKQVELLQQEMADLSERAESERCKLEHEKNSLEAELTKALQDLMTVSVMAVDCRNCVQ